MPVDQYRDGASEEVLKSLRPFFVEIVSPLNINMKERAWPANKIMRKIRKKAPSPVTNLEPSEAKYTSSSAMSIASQAEGDNGIVPLPFSRIHPLLFPTNF